MQVRLTRKLANRLNDIDLSRYTVGDVLDLSPREAALLTAEGWAQPVDRRALGRDRVPSAAAERPRRARKPRR